MGQRFYTAPSVATEANLVDGLIRKGFGTAANISPPAILTFPMPDYEGDIIHADGGEWIERPIVDFDHGIPVGVAAKAIVLKSLKIGNDTFNVPIGQTRFFEKEADLNGIELVSRDAYGKILERHTPREVLNMASQCARLVNDGVVPGVSVELEPIESRRLGKSLLRGRNGSAYEFIRWKGVGWAHTPKPVNANAMTVIEDKVFKALDSNTLDPRIRKSLSASFPRSRRTVVKGNYEPTPEPQAMNDEEMPDEMNGDGEPMDQPEEMPGNDMPTPAVKAMYDGAQSLLDLCAMIESQMQQSEHLPARKYATKVCADLKKTADEVQAMGDKIAKELSGEVYDEEEPDGDEDGEDTDSDGDGEPVDAVETDDDGTIINKSFPNYKPRRFKVSDLGPAVKKSQRKNTVEVDADEYKRMLRIIDNAARRLA